MLELQAQHGGVMSPSTFSQLPGPSATSTLPPPTATRLISGGGEEPPKEGERGGGSGNWSLLEMSVSAVVWHAPHKTSQEWEFTSGVKANNKACAGLNGFGDNNNANNLHQLDPWSVLSTLPNSFKWVISFNLPVTPYGMFHYLHFPTKETEATGGQVT